MADDITTRLSTEGADPLLLGGINDANLVELERLLEVRASLRGDTLSLIGTSDRVERAIGVVQGLVELARMGEAVALSDVSRLASEGPPAEAAEEQAHKIVLPGLRRVITARTPGQGAYLQTFATNDIVIGIGPAGTGKTYQIGRASCRERV